MPLADHARARRGVQVALSEPEVLRADVKQTEAWLPVWSPSGEWILYEDAGVELMTPDGKSLTYSTRTSTANLWLIEGLNAVTPDDGRD